MTQSIIKAPDSALPIRIQAQYIKDLSFENPNPVKTFQLLQSVQPKIAVSVTAKAEGLGRRNFEVVLDVRIETSHEDNPLFITEISYGNIVTLADQVKEEEVSFLLMVVVPRLMFPFVRTLLADVSRDGGFPPLMLSPIDFEKIYAQQKATIPSPKKEKSSKPEVKARRVDKALRMQIEFIAQESTRSIH